MNFRAVVTLGALAVAFSGCEAMKSENPTSPSVAGPIAGVTISAPKLLEPWGGFSINMSDQPVTLLIENASSSGQRPLTYSFEVSTTADFSTKVFTREAIAPGSGGRTSLKLPDALASDRVYYWRAKAEDGANTGPFSGALNFSVVTPIPPSVIDLPQPLSPIGGLRVATQHPEFSVRNSTRSGPIGSLFYMFEVSENSSFTASIALVTIPEQPGVTKFTLANEVGYDRGYFWRVSAHDSVTRTSWSPTHTFMGPVAPAPPPTPAPSPGGGGSTGNWRSCSSLAANKEALVRCVHAAVVPAASEHGAFEVTKRVAWLLRGERVGLLRKDGGENVVTWKGQNFSAGRVCYTDGHIFKVLTDVGGTNGPTWADNEFVSPSLYVPAIDPDS